MKEQLEKLGIEFEFLDAFHGKDYYDDERYFARDVSLKYEKRVMSPGEIGCALSHQAIYRKLIDEDIPYALIFEDDAVISPDILKVLPEIEKHIQPNQLITLERCDFTYKKSRIQLYENYYLAVPYMVKYGSIAQTAGYIITKEAAKKILNINFPIFTPADCWKPYMKIIDFRGVIPSQTIVHQNMNFESSVITGIRNTACRSTIAKLLFYNFYTQWALGRFLKKIYQKTFKVWLKK